MSKLTSYKLKDICSFIRGSKIDIKNNESNKKYPIINNIDNIEFYNDTFNRNEDTILINLYGECGYILKYDFKIFLTQHFYSIHSKDKYYLDEEYLYYYLKNIQNEIYNIRKGKLLNFISINDIKDLHIHIPSIDDQKAIIEKIKQNNSLIDKLEKNIEEIKKNNNIIINEL